LRGCWCWLPTLALRLTQVTTKQRWERAIRWVDSITGGTGMRRSRGADCDEAWNVADASRTDLATLRDIRALPIRLLGVGMLLSILDHGLSAKPGIARLARRSAEPEVVAPDSRR